MKTYRLEKELRKDFVDALNKSGDCRVWPNHESGVTDRGRADVTGVYQGLAVAFELKMIGNKQGVSPLQDKWLQGFADAGGFCGSITYFPGDAHLEFRRWVSAKNAHKFQVTNLSLPLREGIKSAVANLLEVIRHSELSL